MRVAQVSGSPLARARSVLAPLAVLAAGLAAALALAEVTARVFFPAARDHALPRSLVVVDDVLGWRLAKGVRVTHATSDFEVDYAVNSLGFRDRERRREPPAERPRLLLYGDSQVFGWGVPAERRFSAELERRLGLELWNLAVPGYGIDQQALAYDREGDREAAAVVLLLSQATVRRVNFDYRYGIHKPSFRSRAGSQLRLEPPAGGPSRAWLFRLPGWLYLPYMLDQALSRVELRLGVGRLEVAESGPPNRLVRDILRFAGRRARSRQQRLMVLADLPPAEEKRLRRACRRLDLDWLTIRLPKEGSLAISDSDSHWNAAAHELIAGQLAPQITAALRDREALPLPGGPC